MLKKSNKLKETLQEQNGHVWSVNKHVLNFRVGKKLKEDPAFFTILIK